MKNKDSDRLPPVKKEQLFSEKAFIQHCIHDYHDDRKLDGINEAFLRAAESDEFLKPLLQVEEDIIQKDGSHAKALVNYYSPHQIFIVAALANNQVHDGFLWEPRHLDFYKQQGFRMVQWGKEFAFNITLLQGYKKTGILNITNSGEAEIYTVQLEEERRKDPNRVLFEVCVDFHSFLKVLHSLNQLRYDTSENRNKDRYFAAAPSLCFDFSSLRIKGKQILKKSGLNKEKLIKIAYFIANLALNIDPLEYWYYYIKLHPQRRKDLFKGKAALAQELYRIYDLIIEVIEIVFNEKQPPMFEMIYGKKRFSPYLIPKIEYVNGTDVKSMWAAIQKFKEWMKKSDNKDFVEKSTIKSLESFEKELKEYEDKYGARSFISNGVREVEVEDNIKIEDLDLKTKRYVEDIIHQAKAELVKSKRQFLSLWDDELEEKVKHKEITLEQARNEDHDLFMKREIFSAIEFRLSDLTRELWSIFSAVQKKIAKKVDEAWRIEHDFGNHFWFQHKDELNTLTREKHHELYQAEHKKAYEEARYWSNKRDDFGNIEFTMDLLFCDKCRLRPVRLHHNYSDGQISTQYLCDDCFTKIEGRVLDMTAEDWKQVKEGEWQCDCYIEGTNRHPTLYKFAHRNIISLWSKNNVPIKVELSYGKAVLEAKCFNCGQIQQKELDWGWND